MIVKDEDCLAEFRSTGCEWCRKNQISFGHHVYSRGAGRLDVSWNLISLCLWCHHDAHNGKLSRQDLLLIVAHRENCLQSDIEAAVHRLRRAPKECEVCPECNGIGLVHQAVITTTANLLTHGLKCFPCQKCGASGCLLNGEPWRE